MPKMELLHEELRLKLSADRRKYFILILMYKLSKIKIIFKYISARNVLAYRSKSENETGFY